MELVSIITPTYNCASFVLKTIDSVLSQTYKSFELIIIDDCSTDNTVNIIESYKDPRIVLLKNKENSGAAYSRNRGINAAKGDYIAFLDGDDIWSPNKLEKQLKFMIDNNYGFSYTNFNTVDENGHLEKYYFTGPKKVTHKMFIKSNYIGCSTAMYKRDIFPDLEISPEIKKRNDYALWLLISTKSDCFLLDDCLASYRINNSGLSKTRKSKLLKHHRIVFEKALNFNKLHSLCCSLINVLFLFIRRIKYRKHYRHE